MTNQTLIGERSSFGVKLEYLFDEEGERAFAELNRLASPHWSRPWERGGRAGTGQIPGRAFHGPLQQRGGPPRGRGPLVPGGGE
ncbi:hypothetical protein [Streptomyces coeruleorubidus]|uniref:hypothetical protein n=1 Tax=Streptomyces coeruleorubidus TaxID=116188 RepID=UPI0033DB9D63